jgi:WD40 repeat protein
VSSRGETIAVGASKIVKLLETNSGRLLKTIDHNQGAVNRIEFSPDTRWLATTTEDGKILIWDIEGRLEKELSNGSQISALRFSPDGRTLATANAADFTISLWDVQSGSVERRLNFHSGVVNALAFSPDSQKLASGGADRMVVIWDVISGKSKRKFKEHDQTVSSLAFSPDGTVLATAAGNASVVMWDVEDGKVNRLLR